MKASSAASLILAANPSIQPSKASGFSSGRSTKLSQQRSTGYTISARDKNICTRSH
jgi:hypothetical protein